MQDETERGLAKNGYIVVDRSSLKELRNEIGLSYSGMVDDTQILQVGKMAGATHLITGKALSVSEGTGRILNTWSMKVVDLERMTVVGIASFDFWME